MQTATQAERITLYYRQGASDKVYQVAIEPSGTGFVVTFAFGRRGSTLQTGSKTPSPVGHAEAQRIYQKLVEEKVQKGYTPGEEGTPYQQTAKQQRATAILPQLLNPIDEEELEKYLSDDRWWMQEKFDGRRALIRKDGDGVIGINRSGLTIDLPRSIAEAVRALSTTRCVLDGEAIGDSYTAFDLLEEATLDLRQACYGDRYAHLLDLIETVPSDSLRYATTAMVETAKRELLAKLKGRKAEGVVFKRQDASYTPGRPSSGGPQLKCKFYATASCIVAAANGSKRSVALQLVNGRKKVPVGNVTIPVNRSIPGAGAIVEVRYLYAYPGGSLFQPVYLGSRDDMKVSACRTDQLKYKPADKLENDV